MFDFNNLKKIPKLAEHAPQAMEGFKALDSAAMQMVLSQRGTRN